MSAPSDGARTLLEHRNLHIKQLVTQRFNLILRSEWMLKKEKLHTPCDTVTEPFYSTSSILVCCPRCVNKRPILTYCASHFSGLHWVKENFPIMIYLDAPERRCWSVSEHSERTSFVSYRPRLLRLTSGVKLTNMTCTHAAVVRFPSLYSCFHKSNCPLTTCYRTFRLDQA